MNQRNFWLTITIVVTLFIGPIHLSKPCCNGENIMQDHMCIDETAPGNRSETLLKCQPKFFIDPLEEEVIINDEDELIDGQAAVPYSEYCITRVLHEEGDDNTTQIIYLVCFSDQDQPSSSPVFWIKGTLLLISAMFLVMTLYIYILLPDLRETQDKVTWFGVMCLMMFMLLLSFVQLHGALPLTQMCSTIAFLLYFFIIAYFAWLNVIMANVWKLTVGRGWRIKERTWYTLNHIYAWTVASTLTILAIIYDYHYDSVGSISCWFRTIKEQEFFVYLPLTITIGINVILFLWTSWCLHKSGDDISPDRKKALHYKCMLYLKLFLLAGLIWIFEIISFHFGSKDSWVWLLIDSVNCLHGVLIFLVLIVWRHRIKRELAGRKILCIRAPASWANIQDDEQEQLEEDGDRDNYKYDMIIK